MLYRSWCFQLSGVFSSPANLMKYSKSSHCDSLISSFITTPPRFNFMCSYLSSASWKSHVSTSFEGENCSSACPDVFTMAQIVSTKSVRLVHHLPYRWFQRRLMQILEMSRDRSNLTNDSDNAYSLLFHVASLSFPDDISIERKNVSEPECSFLRGNIASLFDGPVQPKARNQ
jgi:hypothetical protein